MEARQKFSNIVGKQVIELPPFIIAGTLHACDNVFELAMQTVEIDGLIEAPNCSDVELIEEAKRDMAHNMEEQYFKMFASWHFGDAILDWIRQCEITFKMSEMLSKLLQPDLWPHAGRTSFVSLLSSKHVISKERAKIHVGTRLAFREPPPISCFTDHFLFYLGTPLTMNAYRDWASKTPKPVLTLPPNRFHFEVERF